MSSFLHLYTVRTGMGKILEKKSKIYTDVLYIILFILNTIIMFTYFKQQDAFIIFKNKFFGYLIFFYPWIHIQK